MAENSREPRKYQLRQRADAMEATRQRIIDATIELHGTVGPARTTIMAIAELAGVQRHTVYRHFPTDDELFAACSATFWTQHPWPDQQSWGVISDPAERFTTALGELYAWYADVEPMLTNVLRDTDAVPVVHRALASFTGFLDDCVRIVLTGWTSGRGRRRTLAEAAVRHAISFHTWRSLVRECRLPTADAIALMRATVEAAAT